MNESIISVRYTKALFNLAVEKSQLESVKNDMDIVFHVMNESLELQLLLKNPILSSSIKEDALGKIFTSFNKLSLSFINLLIKNRREEHLHDISRDFLDKYRVSKGIETAVFTTATAIDSKMLENVKDIITKALRTQVEMSNNVDERIIGGYILRVGDKQFDASVNSSLEKMKRKLLSTTIH